METKKFNQLSHSTPSEGRKLSSNKDGSGKSKSVPDFKNIIDLTYRRSLNKSISQQQFIKKDESNSSKKKPLQPSTSTSTKEQEIDLISLSSTSDWEGEVNQDIDSVESWSTKESLTSADEGSFAQTVSNEDTRTMKASLSLTKASQSTSQITNAEETKITRTPKKLPEIPQKKATTNKEINVERLETPLDPKTIQGVADSEQEYNDSAEEQETQQTSPLQDEKLKPEPLSNSNSSDSLKKVAQENRISKEALQREKEKAILRTMKQKFELYIQQTKVNGNGVLAFLTCRCI